MKYLVSTSKHHAAARRAVTAYLKHDEPSLDQLSGGHYPDDGLPIERPHNVLA